MKITILDCIVCDSRFEVFRANDCTEGSLTNSEPPTDAKEPRFQVWSCEGDIITQDLPWLDCVWIANALNAKSDRE